MLLQIALPVKVLINLFLKIPYSIQSIYVIFIFFQLRREKIEKSMTKRDQPLQEMKERMTSV